MKRKKESVNETAESLDLRFLSDPTFSGSRTSHRGHLTKSDTVPLCPNGALKGVDWWGSPLKRSERSAGSDSGKSWGRCVGNSDWRICQR